MMFEMVGTCVIMDYVMYVVYLSYALVVTLAYSLPWLEGKLMFILLAGWLNCTLL